jgi:AI-2 transport protein TqsA
MVVVIAGLKAAKALALPFLFAVLLAILVLPAVVGMERWRVPRALAVLSVVLGVLGVLVAAATLTAQTAGQFADNVEGYQEALVVRYQAPIQQGMAEISRRLGRPDLKFSFEELGLTLDHVMSFLGTPLKSVVGFTLGSLVDLFSNLLVLTITLAFILFEAPDFPDKVRAAFADGANRLQDWGSLVGSVQRYLLLKTVISAGTGVLLGLWTAFIGVDFPLLWGILAFALNFIPTVGSIVAAVPPMLLALVQLGPASMVAVGVGFLVVNISIGNLLEPRIMGEEFGLSTLAVFLSLVFWGWLWGPAGMLLSVPLTVVLQKSLAHSDSTRWVAVMLGSTRELRATEAQRASESFAQGLLTAPLGGRRAPLATREGPEEGAAEGPGEETPTAETSASA